MPINKSEIIQAQQEELETLTTIYADELKVKTIKILPKIPKTTKKAK